MTPAGVKPGDIADDRNGAGSASDRMIVEDRATGDRPTVVVHVEETISPALAGHEGLIYESPPLPRIEALALVRVLIGRDCRTAERDSWRSGRGRAAHRQAAARGERRDQRERTPIGDRGPTMNDKVRLIAPPIRPVCTSTPSKLARAGITPGSRATIEIGPYAEEDWVADSERTFSSGKEFLAILGVAPRTPSSSGADLPRPWVFRRAFAKLDARGCVAFTAVVPPLAGEPAGARGRAAVSPEPAGAQARLARAVAELCRRYARRVSGSRCP